ncbi:BON domain-containing protein [Catelliglobosispora koreensis]|uniref:BON domain-containing protein n=1 Tax=Catelliglobosispora koreensis TaxID=129052 RepID=UPI00037E1DA5|nr:BON domain-containing protein [Catelliglobosispora koreensis]
MTQTLHQRDQDLHDAITEELHYDPRVDAANITVQVNDGAVRLSGEVASLPQKLAASRSVMRVRGVRAVAETMTVSVAGASDDDLARLASTMLTWSADVPRDSVKAEVRNHVITLTGTVAWQYQRDAAVRVVMNLRGVTAVNNQIVLHQPEGTVSAAEVITSALSRNALIDPKAIVLEVDGSEAVLSGEVNSHAAARQAEHAAWAAPGITRVRNELIVVI